MLPLDVWMAVPIPSVGTGAMTDPVLGPTVGHSIGTHWLSGQPPVGFGSLEALAVQCEAVALADPAPESIHCHSTGIRW